ncbi:MAG: NAD(+)/NADH kinase, partial [Limisphaerales bacterium]
MKKRPERIARVGLVANTEKPECRPLLAEAAQLLAAHGLETMADAETLRMAGLKLQRLRNTADVARTAQLLLVFGGDGTILRVAREIAGSPTPLLGIHVGRLGFLAGVTATELPKAIHQIVTRDFSIENRSLMAAVLHPRRRAPAL